MTAPVDVLAVLRRVSRDVSNEDFVQFDDCIGAIAELIAAAGEVAACFGEDEQWWERAYDTYMTGDNEGSDVLIRNSQDVRKLILENFRSALAAVGVQS